MSRFYVTCELGAEQGRISLGTLHRDGIVLSEVRRFGSSAVQDGESRQWDVPGLFQEILEGLRSVGGTEEPVDGISCHSWGSDYLLLDGEGSLITPTYLQDDPRGTDGMKKVLSAVPAETIYQETGRQTRPGSTLCQLATESSRRLKRAVQLVPVADGFHFLLSGVSRVEHSLASTTSLYNPQCLSWSPQMLEAVKLPPQLLPQLVASGTVLGALRPELVKHTHLEDAQVVTACSHELSAALAGLPLDGEEPWAFLRPGSRALMGTQLGKPLVSALGEQLGFNNQPAYGGGFNFFKEEPGFWILEECQRYWAQVDRGLDVELLMHLAGSAPPFESLINPADERFQTPGEMPLKIQAYCKETGQPVPRKPGPIFRCLLESLALLYRKTLQEIEYLTGTDIRRIYLLGGSGSTLLNYFVANALQVPATVVPAEAGVIGNIVVQALALGHLHTRDQASDLIRRSFKFPKIVPHATAWDAAYDRLVTLMAA